MKRQKKEREREQKKILNVKFIFVQNNNKKPTTKQNPRLFPKAKEGGGQEAIRRDQRGSQGPLCRRSPHQGQDLGGSPQVGAMSAPPSCVPPPFSFFGLCTCLMATSFMAPSSSLPSSGMGPETGLASQQAGPTHLPHVPTTPALQHGCPAWPARVRHIGSAVLPPSPSTRGGGDRTGVPSRALHLPFHAPALFTQRH